MEDSVDYGLVALDFVKHRVRKSSHECTVVALVDERIHQGISLDCKERCLQTAKKLHAKTKGLVLVPGVGTGNILLGLRKQKRDINHRIPEWTFSPLTKAKPSLDSASISLSDVPILPSATLE